MTLEMRQLLYFAVMAEELGLGRASEQLLVSQPLLNRYIKALEERFGVALLKRHENDVALTDEGRQVLELILPPLNAYKRTCAALEGVAAANSRPASAGVSSAFAQGFLVALEQALLEQHIINRDISRQPSPRLIRAVKQGGLDLALVALPVADEGLTVAPLGYEERMRLAMPSSWPESGQASLCLRDLKDRPLFWFQREADPAFYDFAGAVFAQAGYSPQLIEEPAEHDALLARVASGEAAALLGASFSLISRPGVSIRDFQESSLLKLGLGVAVRHDREKLLHIVLETLLPLVHLLHS